VYSDRGYSNKAIRFFEKAYQLEPWETDHLYSIAADYRKLNDFDKAMEYPRKIQEQTPNDADAYYYIADLYGEQDKIDEAINTINFGLLQTDNDPSLLYLLAYAFFVKGSRQDGLEALERALVADFEGYADFIEFDRELLANDTDILELIAEHKKSQENLPDTPIS
jgi:tetratricopeptide (TPR) repeat protein